MAHQGITVQNVENLRLWKESKRIGIIGLGDMGRLYATKFTNAGWK